MKDPLVDYSSVCYPDMGAPGALHLPFCAPLGATLRSRVLPGVPASTSIADIPTGSGDLQDAWANQFCTIFLGLFLLKAGVHEKSHPTSNAPGDSGSREGSFTPSHQRANVAPLQSSPVRRTPARWFLTKINFSLLSEVGVGLFQMVITFQWEST